jgi:hypothetical protein
MASWFDGDVGWFVDDGQVTVAIEKLERGKSGQNFFKGRSALRPGRRGRGRSRGVGGGSGRGRGSGWRGNILVQRDGVLGRRVSQRRFFRGRRGTVGRGVVFVFYGGSRFRRSESEAITSSDFAREDPYRSTVEGDPSCADTTSRFLAREAVKDLAEETIQPDSSFVMSYQMML